MSTHWSDLTRRLLRVATIVMAVITITFLVIFLAGVTAWRIPLAVAVVTNSVLIRLLLCTRFSLRDQT